MSIGRSDYEKRKQAKIDRASELAVKANEESNSRYQTAHKLWRESQWDNRF